MIYFDNAATSWPKPREVTAAMVVFMELVGANPGRSGHSASIKAGRTVLEAREAVAELVGIKDPMRIVFGLNATEGLNLGIYGLLGKGDHVITSGIEHNSVMRPLRALESEGLEITVIPCSQGGSLDPSDVEKEVRTNTKLIVMNHASNVSGTLIPISRVGAIARDYGVPFLVDSAQTAGCVPIDMTRDNIDLLAFTGHKSLLGPQGTGGLAISDDFDISSMKPLKTGGTGSRSEHEIHPDFLPDKYESGTSNTVGLAGLAAGVRFIQQQTVVRIHEREKRMTERLLNGLKDMSGVRIIGPADASMQTATTSFLLDDMSPSEAGLWLDERHDIACRVGLHCAPSAHRTLGTFPDGTIRWALGYFTREFEVDFALEALERRTNV